mmetsp:Transcript_36176/g.62697  ORF Transcript_36176/g.62697 Transcript_36176/m.62697 type:complete len:778 (+) Transcript_36176:137-2470(+)
MGANLTVIADAEGVLLSQYRSIVYELELSGKTTMSRADIIAAAQSKIDISKDLTLISSLPEGMLSLAEIGDRLDTLLKSLEIRDVTITTVRGRQIIDSRGNPTVEVDVVTSRGVYRASVPSGASTGIYEACELRDGGAAYLGKAVGKAVAAVNNVIAPALLGKDPRKQEELDQLMLDLDGTPNKTKLGANAILGVSLALAKAGAGAKGVPLYRHFADLAGNDKLVLPVPSFNVINGGSHAGNKLAFQEFMIMPVGASTFSEAMQIGAEVYHTLKKVIKERYGQDATNVGDEGGFAPNIQSNREGVELLMEARERSGHADKVVFAMDVAASEFKVANGYDLDFKTKDNDGSQVISGDALKDMFKELATEFPIESIEDPFDQDDWDAYSKMTGEMGQNCQIVGDDLLVTNPARIQEAAEKGACNALLLKVNQIGSITEAIRAVKMAKRYGWGVMTSHRSGETEDCYIADLAVGLCTGQIKTGAPCRSERLAKYNQLLRIEQELGDRAVYAGRGYRKPAWMAETKYTLVLTRHGESQWNVENKFTGWYDCPLTEKGVGEARTGGTLIKAGGFQFDQAYTSVLKRAIETCWQVLESSDQMWVPVERCWRLNERHYGALQGLDKKETVAKHGAEQVNIWRRSYDIPPPALDEASEHYPGNDPRYAGLAPDQLPKTESLAITLDRVMPEWEGKIAPAIRSGRRVLIAAHGNSLRALVKHLDDIPEDVICELNIPTGVPLVYELDENLKPIPHPDAIAPLKGRYLGDQEQVRARIEGVKAQTGK